jgi:hypothetical protein
LALRWASLRRSFPGPKADIAEFWRRSRGQGSGQLLGF